MPRARANVDTGISALATLEAQRNERRTLSAGALLGERRAALARIVLLAVFTLTVEVIPRFASRDLAFPPARSAILAIYALFTIGVNVHVHHSKADSDRWLVRPFAVTLLDFAFIATMALTDPHTGQALEPEMLAMAGATLISFSIARLQIAHVAFAVICAAATFVAVSAATRASALDALLFVIGAFALIGVVVAATNIAVRRMFDELRQRDGLARFLPGPVVDRVLSGGTESLAPVQREVTVLFTDIRGFTTMSEHMAPRDVMALLDEYLGRMSQIVKGHDGVVGKFLGDGMLAFWGAPDHVPDHPTRAVRAARDMLRALDEMNQDRLRNGAEPLRIGVGVHTGVVAAGMLGGATQAEYTIIGDTVNVASRIESLTKTHGVDVLMSETTWNRLNGVIRGRRVAEAEIRGRSQPIVLYSFD